MQCSRALTFCFETFEPLSGLELVALVLLDDGGRFVGVPGGCMGAACNPGLPGGLEPLAGVVFGMLGACETRGELAFEASESF